MEESVVLFHLSHWVQAQRKRLWNRYPYPWQVGILFRGNEKPCLLIKLKQWLKVKKNNLRLFSHGRDKEKPVITTFNLEKFVGKNTERSVGNSNVFFTVLGGY